MGYASFPKTAAPTRVRWRCGSVRFSPRRVRGTGTFDRDAADRRSRRIHRSPAERKTRPIERARTRRAAGLGVRKTPVLPEVMRFPDSRPGLASRTHSRPRDGDRSRRRRRRARRRPVVRRDARPERALSRRLRTSPTSCYQATGAENSPRSSAAGYVADVRVTGIGTSQRHGERFGSPPDAGTGFRVGAAACSDFWLGSSCSSR